MAIPYPAGTSHPYKSPYTKALISAKILGKQKRVLLIAIPLPHAPKF
jgi:hypothetical protein